MSIERDYIETKHNLESMAFSPLGNNASMAIIVNDFAKRHPNKAKQIGYKPFSNFNTVSLDIILQSFQSFNN